MPLTVSHRLHDSDASWGFILTSSFFTSISICWKTLSQKLPILILIPYHFERSNSRLTLWPGTDIMSPRRGSATASSPHSEHDTTFHGTPSTNTTSFTPATGSKCYRKPTVEDEDVIYHNHWDKARDAAKHGPVKRTIVTKPAGYAKHPQS